MAWHPRHHRLNRVRDRPFGIVCRGVPACRVTSGTRLYVKATHATNKKVSKCLTDMRRTDKTGLRSARRGACQAGPGCRGRDRVTMGAFSHSARTAPIITLFISGTPLKATPPTEGA